MTLRLVEQCLDQVHHRVVVVVGGGGVNFHVFLTAALDEKGLASIVQPCKSQTHRLSGAPHLFECGDKEKYL